MRRMLILALVALTLAGCSGGNLDGGRAVLTATTTANRAIWEKAAIANYEYVYQRSCFCGADFIRPLRIQVRNGTVSAVSFYDTGEAVTDTTLGPFPTIDGVFDDLQSQLLQAHDVNAAFDPRLGFPTQYSVDREANVVDEEYSIAIGGFREL
jgi:hypothetical protein